jgi:hypothetical protein
MLNSRNIYNEIICFYILNNGEIKHILNINRKRKKQEKINQLFKHFKEKNNNIVLKIK